MIDTQPRISFVLKRGIQYGTNTPFPNWYAQPEIPGKFEAFPLGVIAHKTFSKFPVAYVLKEWNAHGGKVTFRFKPKVKP